MPTLSALYSLKYLCVMLSFRSFCQGGAQNDGMCAGVDHDSGQFCALRQGIAAQLLKGDAEDCGRLGLHWYIFLRGKCRQEHPSVLVLDEAQARLLPVIQHPRDKYMR